MQFQSTPSVGRETFVTEYGAEIMGIFQSTPSVGRETHSLSFSKLFHVISIHSLRGEGDHKNLDPDVGNVDISIHSLRGEGD